MNGQAHFVKNEFHLRTNHTRTVKILRRTIPPITRATANHARREGCVLSSISDREEKIWLVNYTLELLLYNSAVCDARIDKLICEGNWLVNQIVWMTNKTDFIHPRS